MERGKYKNFMEKYKGKKIFRRMFAACFGLAAVCIFGACVMGFFGFRSTQLQKEKQDHKNMLYAYSLMLDSYRTSVSDIVEVLKSDTYVKKVMNRSSFGWDEDMGVAAQEIINMISVNPMFHSIYVFGNGEYILKSSNPSYPMNQQGDAMMQGIFQGSVFGEYSSAYYIDIYGKSKTLLCLSSGEIDPGSGKKENGIMVSLDMGRVMDSILPVEKEGEQYLLVNSDGSVIYAKGGMYANSESITNDSLTELLGNCTGQSSEILSVEGEKYLTTCVRMDEDFSLLQLIPYQSIASSVNHVGGIFLGLGTLLVLIVLLLAFMVSNLVYHPIDEMVRTAEGEGIPAEKMAKQLADTELYSIAKTYQSMVETLNHFNSHKEQAELAAYLGSRSTEKELPEWVEETYGKETIYSRLICLRISDTKDFHDNNTEEAIAFELETIRNIVEQRLKGLGDILVTPMDSEYLAVMVFSEERIEESKLISAIGEVFEVIGELMHMGLDAGVSNEKEGFANLNMMYQMARAATAYRFMYGMDAIVTEDDMTARALKGNTAPDMSLFMQKLKEGDREGFTEEYYRIIGEIKGFSIQAARDVFVDMAARMLSYYHSLHYRFEPLSKADYEGLVKELSAYEYMDDIGEWFFRLSDEIWMMLARSRQTGREDVVDKAMAYLRENYADSNISAQLLADKYHITPSYFSRLFHEKCGCAFPDYLAALRIEKAKELLLSNKNKSIQEICEMVGYSNPSYFTATFKKKFGVTPGQFRRNQKEGKL